MTGGCWSVILVGVGQPRTRAMVMDGRWPEMETLMMIGGYKRATQTSVVGCKIWGGGEPLETNRASAEVQPCL